MVEYLKSLLLCWGSSIFKLFPIGTKLSGRGWGVERVEFGIIYHRTLPPDPEAKKVLDSIAEQIKKEREKKVK